MINKELELLSPAKNLEFGKTAINFGADAVYIGASKFGARQAVGNSIKEIEQLCNYAHKYHSKVFVTLNTIIYENELKEVEQMILQIYNAGADALIIQDMGILEMHLPPIELHASTQMHNIDYRKIQFYEKVGLSRVILARELSLNQIKEIRQNTSIELETFIHGAVCVSYSGQCYMSAFIGNRSANRGECAQPCRLKYDLLDENKNIILKNKHLLSLKDMNRSNSIEDLIDVGIKSFKIEGRLKNLEYLKNVTAFYRKEFDSILEHKSEYKMSSMGKFSFNFDPDLHKTFNRQYSNYFLNGRKIEMNSVSPKSVGKKLGEVVKKGYDYIIISTDEVLANGDGLCYFDSKGLLKGFNVNKFEKNKVFTSDTNDIAIGTTIFRNHDHNFIKNINNEENCRFIPIDLTFSEIDEGFLLEAKTLDYKYLVSMVLDVEKEIANNKEKAQENILNQLNKTGDTIFVVNDIKIELKEIYFLPISVLNKFRREILVDLEEKLGKNHKRKERIEKINEDDYLDVVLDYKSNVSNSLSEKFYKKHGVDEVERAFELSNVKSGKTLMTTKFCLKYELGFCPVFQKPKEKVDLKYLRQGDNIFSLEFDCKNCQMKIKNS